MIKKTALPDRQPGFWHDMLRESLFQHSYPRAELKIITSADEKMDVIWHNYISTDSDIAPRICLPRERYECGMHRFGCD